MQFYSVQDLYEGLEKAQKLEFRARVKMREVVFAVLSWILTGYVKIRHFLLGGSLLTNFVKSHVDGLTLEKGIVNNGTNPWDPKIKKNREKEFYNRVAIEASLGLGEAYMDGVWDCEDLVEFAYRLFRTGTLEFDKSFLSRMLNHLMLGALNLQTKKRIHDVIETHYDIGNDLYETMLDSSMNYTCSYWGRGATNLGEAQIHKMQLIAEKLELKPGMRVLDLGCGFGGLSKYLAQNHGVSVVSVNISREQMAYAAETCKGLPVDLRLCDYRDIVDQEKPESFDRVVSVGLFEHVGEHNYRGFFELIKKMLKKDGLSLVHTIGVGHKDMFVTDPWVHKYIFPNGRLPYITDVPKNIDGLFVLEDFQNIGYDYYRTLVAWNENFQRGWPQLRKTHPEFDERFYRMWTYYLLMAAGTFKARKFQLFQWIISPNGQEGGIKPTR